MRKEEENENITEFRNWLDLPEFLLLSILDRIFLIPDFVAFVSVCKTWRSLAKSSTSRRPPLLLHCQVPHDTREKCGFRILSNDLRSYRAKIACETLAKRCVGCSYGHLIVVEYSKTAIVLANVFAGEEIVTPDFLPDSRYEISFGIMTSPLSSPSCMLLLMTTSRDDLVMCWLPRTDTWHTFKFEFTPRIRSLAVYKGQVFCVDSDNRLVLVEFFPNFTCKNLGLPLPHRPLPYFENFNDYRLIECGDELLLVLFVSADTSWILYYSLKITIEVYRFEFRHTKWTKVDNLGDWCLFIDPIGGSPLSCPNPTSWGGRDNCVYVAGPGCESWSVFPLDGTVIDTTDTMGTECALSAANWTMPRWPSSVWVYPSMLLQMLDE